HPSIKALFQGLAVPYDLLQKDILGESKSLTVHPVPQFIKALPSTAKINLRPFDLKTGKELQAYSPSAGAIRSETYYEIRALTEVEEFLRKTDPQPPLLDKLVAAEQALAAATHVHV